MMPCIHAYAREMKKKPSKDRYHYCPLTLRFRLHEEIMARQMSISELSRLSNVDRNALNRMCLNPVRKQFNSQVIAAIAYALDLKDPGVLFEFINKEDIHFY